MKIRNRGVKPYTAADKTLALDWSAARYNFASEGESGDAGGQFAAQPLNETIQPLGEKTVTLGKEFTSGEIQALTVGNSGLNYRAVIYDADGEKTGAEVRKQVQALSHGNGRAVQLVNTGDKSKTYTLRFSASGTEDLTKAAELTFRSPEISTGRRTLYGLTEDPADGGTLVAGEDKAEITGITVQPGEKFTTELGCSFFADRAVADTAEYTVDVTVTDEATGNIVGAERFVARRLPRKAINVVAERYIVNGKHYLTLSDNSERVSCRWFAPDGRYLGSGYTCSLGEDAAEGDYRLRAESQKDGAVVYRTFSVLGDGLQKSVALDKTGSRVYITFRNPLQDDVDVIVSTQSSKGQTTRLPKGQRTYTVSYTGTGGFNSIVMVTFVVNGVKTETYKLQ